MSRRIRRLKPLYFPLCVLLCASVGFCADPAPPAPEHGAPESIRPDRRILSSELRGIVSRAHDELAATELGRRLTAITEELPVVDRRRQQGAPIRYAPGDEVLTVDVKRVAVLSPLEVELMFVAARKRAAMRLPVDMLDAELAARQATLDYALQKAAARPDFGRLLRKATIGAEKTLSERSQNRLRALRLGEDPEGLFPGYRPEGALERLAFDLVLFSEDPYVFYAAAADAADPAPEAVTFAEVDSFLERYGARLDEVRFRGLGRYAIIGESALPGRVARAAKIVANREGLSRLREGLGLYLGVEQEQLALAVNRWIREGH